MRDASHAGYPTAAGAKPAQTCLGRVIVCVLRDGRSAGIEYFWSRHSKPVLVGRAPRRNDSLKLRWILCSRDDVRHFAPVQKENILRLRKPMSLCPANAELSAQTTDWQQQLDCVVLAIVTQP